MAKSEKTGRRAGAAGPAGTEFAFQAEVARLLHMMVNSVYAEKEVFLRELISNGADACDKLRYEAVTAPALLEADPDLRITLRIDRSARTLSVDDNGIGMTREELIDNLGTVARSGTRAFLEQTAFDSPDLSLVGQFGVGFYAAFMVADRVEVLSRRAGAAEAYVWSSDGAGAFTVEPAPKKAAQALKRGTVVTLRLKADADAYLEEAGIERVVRAYSDHIAFPINLASARDGREELRQLNTASALWARPRAELTEDDYREFYRHVAGSHDAPALTIHYRAEGRHEYTVLLFAPSVRPFDLYDPARSGRIRLYVRRVFITGDAGILPPYLRFMRGVIDSQDMPLNISREMLQNNPIAASIRKAVLRRVLTELTKCAEERPAAFEDVWRNFGAVLKEGLYEDPDNRDALLALARFRTSRGEGWRTLKDYVADLRPNQTAIYYMAGESTGALRASPQLEGFRARGIEVLLLGDPVDNFWVTAALGFGGKPFQSVTQGEADLAAVPLLEEDEARPDDAIPVAAAELLGRLKTLLAGAVDDVRRSRRLVDSPACLVAPSGARDLGLDRLLERQSGAPGRRPVLEVNVAHPLFAALEEAAGGARERFEDLAWLLLEEARILDGEPPTDPAAFATRLNRLVLGRER